jgi:hypothetical protein
VVSHPLRMRKALGSIPSGSIFVTHMLGDAEVLLAIGGGHHSVPFNCEQNLGH